MKILFATAELAPIARVGGLAAAAAGLVAELRAQGVEVEVVLPDYFGTQLDDERARPIAVPPWAGPAIARSGLVHGHHDLGPVTMVRSSRIERAHPYTDPSGEGFADNDHRFFAFSAAVAGLCRISRPDVLHLNDWHTSAVLAFVEEPVPTVLTIHTLGYQGATHPAWLDNLPHHRAAYHHEGACNPLAGAIRLSDLVITVSPTYASEIVTVAGGFGLDDELAARGTTLRGILNGIDATIWDPATDAALPGRYTASDMGGKATTHDALCDELGLARGPGPLIAIVSRLADQKGIDLVVPAVGHLATMPARLAVLGDGDRWLADQLRAAAGAQPARVAFRQGYDEALAHRMFGGADLFLMPSRFEPCGLAQMQAMRYGAIPVVTDVGGLHDTVIDVDRDATNGTGIVALEPTAVAVIDALHRGVRSFTNRRRRDAMRRRCMAIDWSWRAPAAAHVELYEQVARG